MLNKRDKRSLISNIVTSLSMSVMLVGVTLSAHAATIQHKVSSGQTLSGIAKQYNVTQTQIINANGLQATYLIAGQVLNIPDTNPNVVYRVEPGDSLYSLANKFKVNRQTLANINNIPPNSKLVVGETLILPKGADLSSEVINPNAPNVNSPNYNPNTNVTINGQSCVCTPIPNTNTSISTTGKHRVTRGETLTGLAKKYGITTSTLARANNLSTNAMLLIGQVLTIPTPGSYIPPASSSPTTSPSVTAAPRTYKVKAGDGLIKLANKFNVSLTELAKYNGLDEYDQLLIGQVLKIPPNAYIK